MLLYQILIPGHQVQRIKHINVVSANARSPIEA